MAHTVAATAQYAGTATATHTFAITITTGTDRKIVVGIVRDVSVRTLDSVTFDGNAMTQRANEVHSADSTLVGWLFDYDVPDALADGEYDIVFTISGSDANWSAYAWQTTESATGAPEDSDTAEMSTAAAAVSLTLDSTADAIVIAVAQNSSSSPTWTWSGDVSERYEQNEAQYTSTAADGAQASGGSKTVTATGSSTSGNKILLAMSIAAAGGASQAPGYLMLEQGLFVGGM